MFTNFKWLAIAFVLIAAVTAYVTTKYHHSKLSLSLPVYAMYPADSNLNRDERKQVEKWLGFNRISSKHASLQDGSYTIYHSVDELIKHNGEQFTYDTGSIYLLEIEEPYSDNKKKVREIIESKYSGEKRKHVLRNLTIVRRLNANRMADKKYARQLADDLIYFTDNFGGVGLLLEGDNQAGFEKAGRIIKSSLVR